ncbi:4-(cytidine 5'-diphospho)-2-C-methyl-D-erythritol kinase [Pleomorphovibrio marinus]|uniref:4-(cytidine 5'-diphospho)-2-C-methyl-D-erythritol kinase n=1 Tax=Pleomorphovibrio marinus TaxID=2164132 RepID=UPI000E0C2E28|nr:4-(cytidine 5'-diphospho)-2-C-methyl-D-erythritol kinase [Pleomorphovibrio marinus]
MITFPNAKINLGLHVTKKRGDGYHEIESCLIPIPLFDVLEMGLATKGSFTCTGIPIPGSGKENLILKAYQILKNDFPSLAELQIHLHKNIPIGAGLGGGSADAAFSLTLMNSLLGLNLEPRVLEKYAAELGSDCPFFIQNKPKIVTGRGEIMTSTKLNMQGKWIYLVYPQIHISTKEAYSGLTPKLPERRIDKILQTPENWKKHLINDFEASLFSKHPELSEIKEVFYRNGAFYAAMSGSGSAVFGLFDHKPEPIPFPNHYFEINEPLP